MRSVMTRGRRRRTFALDAKHELSFIDVVGELVSGIVVAMGTDCTVKFQRVSVKPASQSPDQHQHICHGHWAVR